MAETFRSTDDLVDALEAVDFDRPPALVANAHITATGVARALSAGDVPVIALDRAGDGTPDGSPTHDGVAPPSNAVDFAGAVTYPLDDMDGFRADVERLVTAAGRQAVAFPCMDEWVRGFAATTPDGVRLASSGLEGIERVLDKANLYALADELGVPYPETYDLSETSADAAVEALGFPLVVKPAHKRKFEEIFGTNVIEVDTRSELTEVVTAARESDAQVLLQEKVPVEVGHDASLASYLPPESSPHQSSLALVGNPRVRFPRGFGTSTVVERVERPAVRDHATAVLSETGYHGISEAEFVFDADRDEYVLLDINTRPWKWIMMPVTAGANLPLAAYLDTTGDSVEVDPEADPRGRSPDDFFQTRWVYLPDYLELLATHPGFDDLLPPDQWRSLVSGSFESEAWLTTGIYRPSDPGPVAKFLESEFSEGEYYCSC